MKRKTFLFLTFNLYPINPTPIRSWINQYRIYMVWFCGPPRRRLGFGVGRQFFYWNKNVHDPKIWCSIIQKSMKRLSWAQSTCISHGTPIWKSHGKTYNLYIWNQNWNMTKSWENIGDAIRIFFLSQEVHRLRK